MPPPPAIATTAPSKSKSFMPTAKSVMDARVAKKRSEKKARLRKQLSKNTEKMNVIKTKNCHRINISCLLSNIICKKLFARKKSVFCFTKCLTLVYLLI